MLQFISWILLHRQRSDILAYELATSLAPLPKALNTKAIVVIANIQSYFAVITGTILNQSQQEDRYRRIFYWIVTCIHFVIYMAMQALSTTGRVGSTTMLQQISNIAHSQAEDSHILRPWLAYRTLSAPPTRKQGESAKWLGRPSGNSRCPVCSAALGFPWRPHRHEPPRANGWLRYSHALCRWILRHRMFWRQCCKRTLLDQTR
jgi:hypothetical protein